MADFEEMLAAMAEGREEAFADLIRQFGPALLRTARTLAGNHAEAEDAVQEVFVGLVSSRHQLTSVSSLPAYLFTSLRRAVTRRRETQHRDHSARKEWYERQELKSSETTSDAGAESRESLKERVKKLPLAEREVLALKLDGELSFREIADVLGINQNTAASRYRYAIDRLRREWRERE